MDFKKWNKVENEAGYPCYVNEDSGQQNYDHPQFSKIMKTLEDFNDIKYSAYKIAFKIFALQKSFKVPPLRISSGVFARHQLSLSESSLSLETAELEAVLADIYFAAEKEGFFTGDVDLAVDLLINFLLNVYDGERKSPIRVLAAKTLLILLSEESISEKWLALANCCADHNGCVSRKRLAALLTHVTALPKYLGCQCDHLESDVDSCFEKSAGMLGISAHTVADWGTHCASTRWLGVVQRVLDSRNCATASAICVICAQPLIQVLKFGCLKCHNIFFCEKCYLYGKDLTVVHGHKKTHLVHEIIDGEIKPPECLGFIKGMKRFFFCTKTKKKETGKKGIKKKHKLTSQGSIKRKEIKPTIFTSTVSKASGNKKNNPEKTLQDIILQLENENKALKELSDQFENVGKDPNNELKERVDAHYSQISKQINRLKILKENISQPSDIATDSKTDHGERPQAFDLFSPIPVYEKQSKVTENGNQPRVLGMDSGNFSVAYKHQSPKLLTMSGDAWKPVGVHVTLDSISAVSMNDISNWYYDSQAPKRPESVSRPERASRPESVSLTECLSRPERASRPESVSLTECVSRPERASRPESVSLTECLSRPERASRPESVSLTECLSRPERASRPESVSLTECLSRPERASRPESVSLTECLSRPERASRPESVSLTECLSRPERASRPESVSLTECLSRPERASRPESVSLTECLSRPERASRPESVSLTECLSRPERASRPESVSLTECLSRPERASRPESVSLTECVSRPERVSRTEQRFLDDARALDADLDTLLHRLKELLTNNFAVEDPCFGDSSNGPRFTSDLFEYIHKIYTKLYNIHNIAFI